MTTQRNPIEVIDNIIAKLPENYDTSLVSHLKRIQEDSFYRPPERQHETWYELAVTLQNSLPFPPTENWQKEIYFIVTTQKYEG